MNRTGKIVICFGIALVLIFAGIIAIKSNTRHQAENAYAYGSDRVFDDGGMYYVSASHLMYLSNATGESVPVCSKTNCTHNTNTCDAFYAGASGVDILLYDDRLYVSYFTEEWYTDSNGQERSNGVTKIETSKKDGSDRKTIYQEDTGAVLSMLAMDGRLYYTAYTDLYPDKENTYYSDNFLYCYDMDWGITKKLAEYKGSDSNYNAGVYLCESAGKDALYLLHRYAVLENNDEIYSDELITLNLQGKEIAREIQEEDYHPGRVKIDENGQMESDFFEECDDIEAEISLNRLYKRNSDGTPRLLFEAMCSYLGRQEENFYYAIIDERNKVLYDCEEDAYYIAKSAVSDEKIVPDIIYIDRSQDVIYYDTTDYTGVAPGTLFTQNPCVEGCMKWSEFLDRYFVAYEGQKIEGFLVNEDGENGN